MKARTEDSKETYRHTPQVGRALWLAALAVLFALHAEARVTRVVVDQARSESPTFGGRSFGADLQYERISGIAYGEIDPNDPRNAIIQDIRLAPKNKRGMVEYASTFTLIKPIDKSKSTKVLVYEVVNRGASIVPRDFSSGDVFLVSGWQGDIPFGGKSISGAAGETVRVPIAQNSDGTPITGPILARIFNVASGVNTMPIRAAAGYATSGPPPLPVDLDTSHAELTTRSYESIGGVAGGVKVVANSDWAWADCSDMPFPGKPDPTKLCVRNGFDPSLLYQLVYQGKDPLVLGVGLAAMRDVVSFFRYEKQDDEGWRNPLTGGIVASIGIGHSQSGNLLRTFLHLGFNQDEAGRRALDGVMAVIAARQAPVNQRFAVPGGASALYQLGSDGVVWWSDWPDTARSLPTAGLLDRCRASRTCPRIMDLLGSTEFWNLRASPDFVGTDGSKDIPLPENVRRYYIASTQHGGGSGGFPAQSAVAHPAQDSFARVSCVFRANPNPMTEIERALLVDLKEWVLNETPPPQSRYPTLAGGDLVPANSKAMGFPSIPGVPPPDGLANPLLFYDLGTEMRANDLSGFLTKQPPAIREMIAPLVPKVDKDGNEIGGIATVQQQAALGTYLGWNITAAGFTKGQVCSLTGSYLPFAETKAERIAAYDSRLSLEERYGTKEGFLCAVKKAAQGLVLQRLLLAKDAEKIVSEAAEAQILAPEKDSSAEARRVARLNCAR